MRAVEPPKPLRVLIAEALGWRRIEFGKVQLIEGKDVNLWIPSEDGETLTIGPTEDWQGEEPDCFAPGRLMLLRIPEWRLEWRWTGPLIHKYKLSSGYARDYAWAEWRQRPVFVGDVLEVPFPADTVKVRSTGVTVLDAVCEVILALHKAGKLKENR